MELINKYQKHDEKVMIDHLKNETEFFFYNTAAIKL